MDLMDLVDSIARREEQEHYIRLFSEEYGATYQRALEVSGLKSAYIKRRVYNEEHEWVPNTRALHVIGKEYQKDIEIWEHALLNIQKKERKNAYRYGKLVYGVELGEFRINMSLEDYEDLIRNANSTKTLEEVRFDEIQSRKVIREMSIKEHVGYYTLRQINDMIYLEEACDTPEDIEKYIHNAWIDLGVAYQSDKWSLEVISFIVRVAKVNTSLDSLCKAILASTESDALRSDARSEERRVGKEC